MILSANIRFHHEEYSDEQLRKTIQSFLDPNELGALSTSHDNVPHICFAYFAHDEDLTLIFISQSMEELVQHISKNPAAAVAFWLPTSKWGTDLRGLPLFGECGKVGVGKELLHAKRTYANRFPAFSSVVKHLGEMKDGVKSRLIILHLHSIEMRHELTFDCRNDRNLHISWQ